MPYLIAVPGELSGVKELLERLVALWTPLATGPVAVVGMDDAGLLSAPDVDRFLQSVGALDEIVLVVIADDWNGIGTRVRSLLSALKIGYPVLPGLRTWVVGQAPPGPTEDLHRQLEQLLATDCDTLVRGALVAARSTARKAATTDPDRTGLMVDAAWALTIGRLALHPNIFEQVGAWWVASESFTSQARAAGSAQLAGAVLEVLTGANGPLRAETEASLDRYITEGSDWVRQQGIGTQDEYNRLTNNAAGDLFQLLAMADSSVRLKPEAWAAGIDREYREAAGSQLGRFRRAARASARQLLHGRRNGRERGHLEDLENAVDQYLRQESGTLRAARFLQGVATELERRSRDVRDRARHHPDEYHPTIRRADLVRAVALLPSPRPWAVRSTAVVAAATAVGASLGGVALLAPAVGSALTCGVLFAARIRASRARLAYHREANRELRAIGNEIVFAEWAALIEEIRRLAGTFRSAMSEVVHMEDSSTQPPSGSLSHRLFALWSALREVTSELGAYADSARVDPVNAGAFVRFFPSDAAELAAMRNIQSDAVDQAVVNIKQSARELMDELSLKNADTIARVCGELLALMEPPVWTLESLLRNVESAKAAAGLRFNPEPGNRPAVLLGVAGDDQTAMLRCARRSVLELLGEATCQDCESDDDGRAIALWVQPISLSLRSPDPVPMPPEPEQLGPDEVLPTDPNKVGA